MPVYADSEDFELENPPENLDLQIRLASQVVYDATLTAVYPVDSEGLPRDSETRDLFRDATVAQVLFWVSTGVDPTLGAVGVTSDRQASSKSIGSASVSYESGATSVQDKLDSLTRPSPVAASVLAALPKGPVRVRG